MCLCLCVCLCVCLGVCLCVCVSLEDMLFTQTLYLFIHASWKNHAPHLNLCRTQFPYPTTLLSCFALPTRMRQRLLSTFHFEFLNSIFFFCCPQTGFYFLFARRRSHRKICRNNNSPTDSEKQTAVASKDKGTFFDKVLALSNTNNVSQDLTRCVFSVCETNNMNPNATNKTCTGPKWLRTQEPEDEHETAKSAPRSTPSLPAKAANDALSNWQLRRSLQVYNP